MNETELKKSQEKIKKLEEAIAKKKAALNREKVRLSQKARKERTRRLIEIGGLAEIAGLTNADKGAILGGLMEINKMFQSKATYENFKNVGDTILAQRSADRNSKKTA